MPAEPVVTLSQTELAGYAGAYLDSTSTRFVRLYVEGDRLKLEGRPGTELAPLAADRFRVFVGGNLTSGEVQFAGLDGGKFAAEIEEAGSLTGSYVAYPDLPAQGAGYTGTFYSADLDTTYSIGMDRGVLTLDSRRFVQIPLLPIGPDQFVMAGALPKIPVDFTMDPAGNATGFTLSLYRARDVQFER